MSALKKLIPSPLEVGREALIVIAGVTVAALVISRFPAWQKMIQNASITVRDQNNNILF